MDRSIPLPGNFRIGLDGLLGLIPGLGDVASAVISSLIILQAHRAGLPKATILRMMANVGIDSVLGSIPLIGDLFDFAFKANTKNLALYRGAISGTRRPSRDAGFLIAVFSGLLLIIALPVMGLIWLLERMF